MSDNVRCTGLPAREVTADGVVVERFRPCGWTGERAKGFRAAELSDQGYREAATTKPCPRCGGRVELVGVVS